MPWYYNPHAGGTKIPLRVQGRTRSRILAHAAATYAGRYERIEVRFKGALCYIDAYRNSSPDPLRLVRMRFFSDEDRWTLAFFTYSNERYEPCCFPERSFHGTPEHALDVSAAYLSD